MMYPSISAVLYPTPEARAIRVLELRSEIAGLKTAISSGVTRASYDGKSVDYADLASLRARMAAAEVELMQLLGVPYRRPTAGFATFTRAG